MHTPWKKSYDKPRQYIKKRRHHFSNKNPHSQFFPAVMYRCENWTIKKPECQRSDAFEFRCWRRLLRVPLTARRSNQFILKEINPEYSLQGLMLKLKLQYFGHLIQRASSLEKTLMRRKTEGGRRRGRQSMRCVITSDQWMWVWANSWRWWRTGKPYLLQSVGLRRVGHDLGTEQQQELQSLID